MQQQCQQPCRQVERSRGKGENKIRAGELTNQEPQRNARHRGRRPARREHRVGHDQLVPGNDMGERGAQPSQDETVGGEYRERRREQRDPRATAGDEARYEHHQRSANDIGDQQHLPSSPPVQDHTRERPDQRVRQEQDRERLRSRRRRGVALR